MSFSGCFAKDIVVDPRLPFATRTILSLIQKSMREEFNRLIKSCGTLIVPAIETKSKGLQHLSPAMRDFGVQSRPTLPPAGGSWFFHPP
jgi:hypothetical protein